MKAPEKPSSQNELQSPEINIKKTLPLTTRNSRSNRERHRESSALPSLTCFDGNASKDKSQDTPLLGASAAAIKGASPNGESADTIKNEGMLVLPTGDLLVPGPRGSVLIMPSKEKLTAHVAGSWILQNSVGKVLVAKYYIPYDREFSPAAITLLNGASLRHVGPLPSSLDPTCLDRMSSQWVIDYPSGDFVIVRDFDGRVTIERRAPGNGTTSSASFFPGLDPRVA